MLKNIFFVILLSILLTFSFTFIMYSRMFSKNGILKELDNINYYHYTYNDLNQKLELELPDSSLKYVYSAYLNEKQIKKDISKILDQNDKIKENFKKNVLTKIGKSEASNNLANKLANTYYNNLFRIDKLNIKAEFKNINLLTIISLFLTIFIILKIKDKITVFNSLIVTGILFILPKLFIHFKNILTNFYYYNNTLSYLIKMYSYSIINIYFKYGLIFLIIGFLGFTIHFLCKLRLTKKNS